MNSKEEDIYNWISIYYPSLLKNEIDFSKLKEYYDLGIKNHVGEFKDGDIISWEWNSPKDDPSIPRLSMAVFKEHKFTKQGDSWILSVNDTGDKYYVFNTYFSFEDINNDKGRFVVGGDIPGKRIVYTPYTENQRLASYEEKIRFFNLLESKYKDIEQEND